MAVTSGASSAYARLRGLNKVFSGNPPTTAVKDFDLEIAEGEFVVLLGPSGCGKTTVLRCIAGLETPDAGRIELGGATVYDTNRKLNVTPDKRSIGMVFQSYALWPHMTVRRNIEYPLRARGLKSKIAEGWPTSMAQMVDCESLLDRYPSQLSGGQQQRVALARGLVARPGLMLFDEPLSNLDAKLRELVRTELHELHERLRFTAIYVTHDQSEAFALGDRIVVMRDGSVEQDGTPQDVFNNPATEYVADFVGMSNLLVCTRHDDHWTVRGQRLHGLPTQPGPYQGSEVRLWLRPEDVLIAPPGQLAGEGIAWVDAHVVDTEYAGRHINVVAAAGDTRLRASVQVHDGTSTDLSVGQSVSAGFRVSAARAFAPDLGPQDTTPLSSDPVEA